MNCTATVIVALIAAIGLTMMVYSRTKSVGMGGSRRGFGFSSCGGFAVCGGGFFRFPIFNHIIETISQVNTSHGNGGDDNTQWSGGDHGDENQKDK